VTTNILRACLAAISFFFLSIVPAQAQSQSKQVKQEPVQTTSPNSGAEMFHSYCAPCPGADGKVDGPAAASLKNPPANLTQLAKKNGGKFPGDHVTAVFRNGVAGAHGSSDMPIWGPLFWQVSGHDNAPWFRCAFRNWSTTSQQFSRSNDF
jgi:mono/diheme cytochrome c family protein